MSFNLAVVLKESANSEPDKAAVIWEDGSLTYRELDQQSDLLATNLARLGIAPGAVVGLQLPNIVEFIIAYYGILKVGAVALPMSVLNKAREVEYFLTDARAEALITSTDSGDEGIRAAHQLNLAHVFTVGQEQSGSQRNFSDLLREVPDSIPPYEQRDPGDTAALLYTSGTTGRPKGVELTHFQLYMNALAHQQSFQMSADTVVVAVMPLFHGLGLSGILGATITSGGTVILYKRFDPEQVLEAIGRYRVTLLHGVPTMYHALLNHPRAHETDTSSLTFCGCAGAPLPAELLDRFEREFGVVIIEMYGLTESGPVATANRADHRKPYSIGTPIWGVELQIWDENGAQLPPGKDNIGELVMRGHNVMRGYLNNPQATAEAFAGGWLHTGDLGYQDEDGFFFIVDRKKELIIRGGYNVYPREVEEVLYSHPAINECAVVGVPDERLGEEVKAYVSLKPGTTATEAELIAYAKERLAAYKYPRSVEIISDLPKSTLGKILKRELVQSGSEVAT